LDKYLPESYFSKHINFPSHCKHQSIPEVLFANFFSRSQYVQSNLQNDKINYALLCQSHLKTKSLSAVYIIIL